MIKVEEKIFKVVTESECHKVVTVERIPRIMEVNTSIPGAKGENATINGLNTLNILAGNNIELEQTEDNLTINGLNTLNILAGDNITIDQEDDTLTINATATPQIQSDMSQEDDTALDFVKNKKGENIITTLYMNDEDEDEMIPVLEENIDMMITIIYQVIIDLYSEFDSFDENKQDKITDEEISIEPYEWNNNECRKYISGQINSNDKVWYSPTEYSYDNFINAEIRMTEVGNGYVDFKCKNTPTRTIGVIIRRAR